jgi:hypothetical protein
MTQQPANTSDPASFDASVPMGLAQASRLPFVTAVLGFLTILLDGYDTAMIEGGLEFTLSAPADNLIRMPKLLGAAA